MAGMEVGGEADDFHFERDIDTYIPVEVTETRITGAHVPLSGFHMLSRTNRLLLSICNLAQHLVCSCSTPAAIHVCTAAFLPNVCSDSLGKLVAVIHRLTIMLHACRLAAEPACGRVPGPDHGHPPHP